MGWICAAHGHVNCRQCFPAREVTLGVHPLPRSDVGEVAFVIRAKINNGEVDKLNGKAGAGGRAYRTAQEVIETALSDSLKHNWVVESYQIDPIDAPK